MTSKHRLKYRLILKTYQFNLTINYQFSHFLYTLLKECRLIHIALCYNSKKNSTIRTNIFFTDNNNQQKFQLQFNYEK